MKQKKRSKTVAWIILTLSLCAMTTFGARLWEIRQTYQEGDESYEQLINTVRFGRAYALEAMQTYWADGENYGKPTAEGRFDGLFAGNESYGQPAGEGRSDGLFADNGGYGQPIDGSRLDGSFMANENYGQPAGGGYPDGLLANNGNYGQQTGGSRPDGLLVGYESDGPQTSEGRANELFTGNESYGQPTGGNQPNTSLALYVPETKNVHLGTKINIPDMFIDFAALREINRDAVAWLYCPDTVIDYPVVRARDYDYYLHHLPDGTTNANGTLFIDYNWVDFLDQLTVVYGHNMKSGRMFGTLTRYKEQGYFEAHPYLYLYTAEGERYRIDLLYGCVIGAGQWRERAFMFKENSDALIAYAAYKTTFKSEAQYEKGDKIIALSTCSYEFDDARYVVIGALRPEYSDK